MKNNSPLPKNNTSFDRSNPLLDDSALFSRDKITFNDNLASEQTNKQSFAYLPWVIATLALLVLTVFLWPKKHESGNQMTQTINNIESNSMAESATKKSTQEPSIFNSSQGSDSNFDKEKTHSFSKDNDLQRAKAFREQERNEKKINSLLKKAEEYIADGKLIRPSGENALAQYKKILLIDNTDYKATSGIRSIKEHFVASGVETIKNKEYEQTTFFVNELAIIDNESLEYAELSQALENAVASDKISVYAELAKEALEKEHYILPAKENALFYYNQITALNPENGHALRGISKIADHYSNAANTAMLSGNYELATGYLSTVSVINPDHKSIPLLDEMINDAFTRSKLAHKAAEKQRLANIATQAAILKSHEAALKSSSKSKNKKASKKTSKDKTPKRESAEQAVFDRQYLENGLSAYYEGKYDKAISLLQPLADKGISRAQFRLGYMHYLGRGFSKNRNKADKIIRSSIATVKKFALEGRSWAESDIGSLYEDGLVLSKSYTDAVYWYRRAAESGYAGAQTNLGTMYARGRGVTKDESLAIEWFKRSALQGDVVAKRNLKALGVNF